MSFHKDDLHHLGDDNNNQNEVDQSDHTNYKKTTSDSKLKENISEHEKQNKNAKPYEEEHYLVDDEKGSNNITKFIYIGLIIALTIGIIILVLNWFIQKRANEIVYEKEPIETNSTPTKISDSPDEDFDGFANNISGIEREQDSSIYETQNSEVDEPIKIIDKDNLYNTENTPNKEEKSEEAKKPEPVIEPPSVKLTGPTIDKEDNTVQYTYYIDVNDPGANKYEEVRYNIDADGCDSDDIFESSNDFNGTLSKIISGRNSFIIEINNAYLKTDPDTRRVPYTLTSNGETLDQGQVDVARCKELESKGEFKISGPGVNKDLVDGMINFGYGYQADEEAIKVLEDGFSYVIDHDCEDWLDRDGQGYFTNDYKAKAEYINSSGFAENVDKDAFKDLDDVTEGSTYKVYDSDGDLVYMGDIDVPKCRDK